jgi:predicted NBD/HSP70 family sugar kinase
VLIQDVKMLEALLESISLCKDEEARVISLTKARQKLEAKNNGSDRNGSNKRVIIFISLGRNVGGALIINGSLHHGANWGNGEFGQILLTTDPNARQDSSGAIGTLEAYCSGPGLVQTFRELAGADPKKDIIADAKQNPYGPSSAAVKKTGEYLGYGLVSLANALDPDLIVIGGSLSKLGDALLGPARQILKQRALPGPANCPIVQAKSEADVPIGYLAIKL